MSGTIIAWLPLVSAMVTAVLGLAMMLNGVGRLASG
jgi:hypothetical protein